MPYRNQSMIRRGINRLLSTLQRYGSEYPALTAILSIVIMHANRVNESWQEFQKSAVSGDKERV